MMAKSDKLAGAVAFMISTELCAYTLLVQARSRFVDVTFNFQLTASEGREAGKQLT